MSEPVLELRGIEKGYNHGTPAEIAVLRGLDLALAPGEVVALVAPSGAGKSTLLHIAGLLDVPDAGTVRLGGVEMGARDDTARTIARRDMVGFIYQFHHLLPEFTALEDLLTRVGLAERMDHRPAELSGGEQQRVAFCRALANAPQLLLADEPTGNLDPKTSEQVFGALMDLVRQTGMSALVATHNPALAARMDRVVRMEAGVLRDGAAIGAD